MPRPRSTGLPREEEEQLRVAALLDVAAEVFLESGFEAASTAEIARRARASKQTFYVRFPSKEKLFLAVVRHRMERRSEHLASLTKEDGLAPREVLLSLGRYFMQVLIEKEHVALVRIIYMEASQFPEIAQVFLNSGPERSVRHLADYIMRQVKRGTMHTDDPQLAAQQFSALVMGDLVHRALLGLPMKLTKVAAKSRVEKGVNFFLQIYGREGV